MNKEQNIIISNLRETIRIAKHDAPFSSFWKKELPKLERKLSNLLINT